MDGGQIIMKSNQGCTQAGSVPLELWTENRALKAKLDAATWLRIVEQWEIDRLIGDDWNGRGSDSSPVRFFVSLNFEVEILVTYAREAGTQILYRFDRDAALAWIRENRPQLVGMGTESRNVARAGKGEWPRPVAVAVAVGKAARETESVPAYSLRYARSA
jgi:hypothetical protein